MRLDLVESRSVTGTLTSPSATPATFRPHDLPAVEVPGLYLHVPFCFHKCHYCDFYSITRQTPQRMERFVDLLLAEADQWATTNGPACRPRTIFFGGGTPSLLPLEATSRLLRGLKDRFDFSLLNEWTVEVNPATASLEYCAMLREHGVDRLSFGAQSFDRGELAILERHHDPADVLRSVEIARSAGFRRVNIDLIYAIPGQDLASWERSLRQALALKTEHLSCYGLTYEPNTPMAVKQRLGTIRGVDEDLELKMLHRTRAVLRESGYHAYEISNYAEPGEACRHNLLYWNGGSYVGLGPSAASHVEGRRWRNRPHLGEWESAVQGGGIPTTDIEHLSPPRRAGELAMLQLRLAEGIAFDAFARQTGLDAREVYRELLTRLRDLRLIELDAAGFRLNDRGVNVADAIAAEFVVSCE
jgi:oxygen-independent coproporphyrinogen-3 oxidase